MIARFVFKSITCEKTRVATAVFGVAAATGLVVWSLGLTVTSAAQSRVLARRMTAPFACWVSSGDVGLPHGRRGVSRPVRSASAHGISATVATAVQSLPGVTAVSPFNVVRTTLDYRPDGRVMQGPPLIAGLVQAPASGCPYEGIAVHGDWPDPNGDEPVAAVCSAVFTPRQLKPPPLGSQLVLLTPSGTVTVKISAIIDLPRTVRGFPTVFASAGALRQVAGDAPLSAQPNLLLCEMDDEAAIQHVQDQVATLQSPFNGLVVLGRREIEAQLVNDKLQNFNRQAPLLLTLAVLTALCVLTNALLVGIEQKLRVLALMRCAGMTAGQVACAVALEGAIIACCGWVVGLLGGWGVLTAFVCQASDTFPEGVALGWLPAVVTAVGVAVVTALSLFWPCRQALKLRPLEALAEVRNREKAPRLGRAILGFALLFPMLILAMPLPLSPLQCSVLLLAVGLPLHFLGLALCLPTFVRFVEWTVGPLVSAALGLDTRLLQRRGSRGSSRTIGMVVTLAVGLASFSAIHIWGGSMMAPFVPSREFPAVIVSMLPNGVSGNAAGMVAATAGVEDGRCLAIEAVQLAVSGNLTQRFARMSGNLPSRANVLLFGADPQVAFGGTQPLAPFRFVAGERLTAAAALEAGGGCVITRMFARQSGMGVGDTLTLDQPVPRRRGADALVAGAAAPGTSPETFKIVGVVDLNWHLVTSRAQLRGRNGMPSYTLGPVFVSETDARRVSGNRDTTFFLWANLSTDYRAQGAFKGGQLLEADVRRVLQIDAANTIRVHHRDEIEDGTLAHGNQLIGDMARAPFWSLIVLSTGIITLLIASFQASTREIAVMRAVGMTRSQLGRMLLGEVIITACCGIALSLVSGVCIGWTFTGWTRAWMPFGGLPLTLSIPWLTIAGGVAFALSLCIIMALPPILWLARQQDESGGLRVL